MCIPHPSLQALADRMGCGERPRIRSVRSWRPAWRRSCRRVLRTGAGLPHLVQWVHTTLPQVEAAGDRGRPVDPDRAHRRVARLLCATLLRRSPARAALALDTVIGV